jgi:2-polyprenyl-3-methyl-5-hydroxy-6-metoxy-1,4-benzoquinol methylase
MDVKYWNEVAENYDHEIFDVLAHDKGSLISERIEDFASAAKKAADLGCGIGKFLPILSGGFGHVYAYDISEKCLEQAREKCSGLSNIDYLLADLSKKKIKLPKVDFVLCVNSIIMPSMVKRFRYLRAISDHLNAEGHMILVVPSFESAIFSKIRRIEWHMRRGVSYGAAVMAVWSANNRQKTSHLQQGIVNIDNVPTKHYLKEELRATLRDFGFEIHEFLRIEYGWETEFSDPPHWMKEPFPWDWLVTARKVRSL